MKHTVPLASLLLITAVALGSGPAAAKAGDEPPASPQPAASPAPTPAAPEPTPAPAPAAATPTAAPAKPPTGPPMPDETLVKGIDKLRKGPLADDQNALNYLQLIETGKASPAQVNDFAAYIAKRGMPKVAAAFQEYAIKLDPENPILWLNLGTIRRTNQSYGPAVTAFKKSIELDPANALAHYNLGSAYDAQKHYDDAIEEYRRALVLDPGLADPRKNPQVVNNENLLAVKLQIYANQAGSLGLPLLQMQKPAPKPAPDKP